MLSSTCSPEEYLLWDQADPWKNEYYAGRIWPLPAVDIQEQYLSAAIEAHLRDWTRKKRLALLARRIRLYVPATGGYFFPDILIAKRPVVHQELPHIPDAKQLDIYNAVEPILLIEVVSQKSQQRDQELKWQHYQQIPSLQEYVLVDSRRQHLSWYRRDASGQWYSDSSSGPGCFVRLASIEYGLTAADIYSPLLPF